MALDKVSSLERQSHLGQSEIEEILASSRRVSGHGGS